MTEIFRPMLAATIEDVNVLVFPLLASPKIDGVRALVSDNGVLVSRNLKPIPNRHVQAKFGRLEFAGLDGELICGPATAPDVFRKTTSAVMSVEGEPDVRYSVFDCRRAEDRPFSLRLEEAQRIVAQTKQVGQSFQRAHAIVHNLVENPEALLLQESINLDLGYEGLMLRDPYGSYKRGRSTLREQGLMKLKRFLDSEAEIVGWFEQMHNGNEATTDELGRTKRSSHKANKTGKGTLGGFTVKDRKTGVEFDIGTGFDDATRSELWERIAAHTEKQVPWHSPFSGEVVKYRYFPSGSKDKPRFPTFLGFRAADDM